MEAEYPETAVVALAERLEGTGGVWLVGGSTGLAIRGAKLDKVPRDLDIYADEEDVGVLHERLADFATDSPAISETGRYRSLLSHYSVHGTVVELVGGFRIKENGSQYTTRVRGQLLPYSEEYRVGGHRFGLVPLAHELIFNVLRDRPDRCAVIAELIERDPALHQRAVRAVVGVQQLSESALLLIRKYALMRPDDLEKGGR